jgi:hypothetical protein
MLKTAGTVSANTEQNRANRAPFVAFIRMTPSSISCDGHGRALPAQSRKKARLCLVSRTRQFGLLFGRKFLETRTGAVQCGCREAVSEKLGGLTLAVDLVKFSPSAATLRWPTLAHFSSVLWDVGETWVGCPQSEVPRE